MTSFQSDTGGFLSKGWDGAGGLLLAGAGPVLRPPGRGGAARERGVYFQWAPWVGHCWPVLLHLEQVSLPRSPWAFPPLQAVQSAVALKHFLHWAMVVLLLKGCCGGCWWLVPAGCRVCLSLSGFPPGGSRSGPCRVWGVFTRVGVPRQGCPLRPHPWGVQAWTPQADAPGWLCAALAVGAFGG